MIGIKNLTFSYHKDKNLFDQLNLDIETGNIYGVLGRNGAGKTTLLKLMAGMLKPKNGAIETDGIPPAKRLPVTLQEIYFIPEEFELPAISSQQMINHVAGFYPKFSESDFKSYLNKFGVEATIPFNHLSFGQCKQVIISFALATNTRYILLDEPTNGLDIPSKSILRKMLASAVNDERAFIISTHQVRDLENMIDPIVILDQGKIIFNQKVETLMNKLAFVDTESLGNDHIIYSEPRFGGFHTICKNTRNELTELNLELLFNGIISHTDAFNAILNP